MIYNAKRYSLFADSKHNVSNHKKYTHYTGDSGYKSIIHNQIACEYDNTILDTIEGDSTDNTYRYLENSIQQEPVSSLAILQNKNIYI